MYLITLFILTTFLGFTQEYQTIDSVKYSDAYFYEFQQDSTRKYSVKSQEMILQIGNRYSRFTSVNKLYADSVIGIYKDEPPTTALMAKLMPLVVGSTTHLYCKHSIYKNYPEKGTVTFTSGINKQYFKVSETTPLQWQLIQNSDTTLLGYSCQKATTFYGGRKYTAWFTMDIPISDGPYKFYGLPGLIIKICDSENQHRFELTAFNKQTNPKRIFIIEHKFINTSPPDYVKALNNYMELLFNTIQRGDKVTMNDDTKAKALNRIKTRNNFIERY